MSIPINPFDMKRSAGLGVRIYLPMVGFCVHIDIQPRLIKNEFKLIVNNIRKNIGIIKNDMLGLYSDNEIKFLEKLESNILDTCKKYEDIFKTLDSAYKSYKDDWL
jgi:serine/threonine-protein kinase HipA